jgi:uroporphyrinogen-III synthase
MIRMDVPESNARPQTRKVVALLESPADGELARVLCEYGAQLMTAALASEALYLELEEVRSALDELAADRYELVLFMTGSAVSSVIEMARELGRSSDLSSALRRVTTVCRGPKATAALRSHGLTQSLKSEEALNDTRLLQGLCGLARPGHTVLRFNGDPQDALAHTLRKRSVNLREIWLNLRVSPDDSREAVALVHAIVEQRVDALVVTAEIQFRRLYQVARQLDLARQLVQALRRHVVVVTIQVDCGDILDAHGIRAHRMPPHPEMLVLALMRFLEQRIASERAVEAFARPPD